MIGYTTGVWDMFHVGHLKLLKEARSLCDLLIVGVETDELVKIKKGKLPVIPFRDRCEIVGGVRFVDTVIPEYNLDKYLAFIKIGYNVLFVGDDHFGEERWSGYESQLKPFGVKVIYLPYTKDISSSKLKEKIK